MGKWIRAARLFARTCLGRDDPPIALDLKLYRPNVGVVLFNARGQVWLGRRVNTEGPYNWQFPQGGVDKGEDLLAAAKRELLEETGVSSVSLLGAIDEWITYDFPEGWGGAKAVKGWRGQKQRWFAFRFEGDDDEVSLDHHGDIEFDAWRWADIAEAPGLVVPFKRAAYERVVTHFTPLART